ncbi:hypothetical protein [Nitratireductor soli]|uniref:hypothetical protein n=1 Tax=Nitratireductor soli TaxID=1670619 RepID=UPI00065E8845|nr:hypothetical protein [Nitratireductor soli]
MGVITVKHYRASKLPADLRAGLADDALVSITVEEERAQYTSSSAATLKEQLARVRKSLKRPVSSEEAAQRIRELRDEWDD